MIDPIPGDHIRVLTNWYYHHGIYIGNDEVVEFGHPFDMYQDHSLIKIIKAPIEEFLSKQGRFKHLFKKGNEHLLEEFQKEVDRRWEDLLFRCSK